MYYVLCKQRVLKQGFESTAQELLGPASLTSFGAPDALGIYTWFRAGPWRRMVNRSSPPGSHISNAPRHAPKSGVLAADRRLGDWNGNGAKEVTQGYLHVRATVLRGVLKLLLRRCMRGDVRGSRARPGAATGVVYVPYQLTRVHACERYGQVHATATALR